MNWDKMIQKGMFEITNGYDSGIRFYFRITKLHGFEIAFLNRLFAIKLNKQ